jgi:phospholipid/cholesterol/gamma-HCH transport system substrate-binding protein
MSKELKVGAFVLASLLIAVGTFVYVANVQVRGVRIPYKAYFKYAGGLDPGAPVRFGGMKCGAVTAVRPCREDATKVEVLLEVREGVPLNADSTAILTSLSPLGDKYLEITTGTSKAHRLSPGATIPSSEPVSMDDLTKQASALIPILQSTLQDVQKDIDQLTGNAQVVLANLQSLTGPQNQRNIALVLANARELLEKESPRIDSTLQNLERASSQASNTLKQASDTLNQASGAVNELRTAAQAANGTMANASRTIDEIRDPIKTDLAELQRTMTDARRLIADLNAVVAANRYNIGDTLENFRAASENLRELTASLRQRPWTLIRGKPAPDRAVPVVTSGR